MILSKRENEMSKQNKNQKKLPKTYFDKFIDDQLLREEENLRHHQRPGTEAAETKRRFIRHHRESIHHLKVYRKK